MNRRGFLRGVSAAPLALLVALLPRRGEGADIRSTADGEDPLVGINIDLQRLMPQDGQWHDIEIKARARARAR